MEKELWKGNEAIAEAAIRAGCDCFFGYPITPQSEVPEYMSAHMPKLGRVFVQSESEVAAINMVYGAGGAGMRTMTSSSSPGISLKQEGISYLIGAEIPAVIVNCMRGGPGLGTIQPGQGDYFQATRGGGNGDYRTVVLSPRHGGHGRPDRPDDGAHRMASRSQAEPASQGLGHHRTQGPGPSQRPQLPVHGPGVLRCT